MFRLAFGVGADIEEDRSRTLERGKDSRKRRTIDRGKSAKHELGGSHYSAGVACTYKTVSLAFPNQPGGHPNRGVPFASHRMGDGFLHADNFGGINDLDRKPSKSVAM